MGRQYTNKQAKSTLIEHTGGEACVDVGVGVCAAFTPNFCQAGVQLTYTCLSTTIADRRGAVTPVCTHLSNMIDTLCKGYPWRTLLGNGTLTLTPPPGT